MSSSGPSDLSRPGLRWKNLRDYIVGNTSLSSGALTSDFFGHFRIQKCLCSNCEANVAPSVSFVELYLRDSPSDLPQLRLPAPNGLASSMEKTHFLCRLSRLSGFDSTGLTHWWPSELLLAHIFLSPQATYSTLWHVVFPSPSHVSRVCELAAGMTAAGGLALATRASGFKQGIWQPCFSDGIDFLALTDGNEECVASIGLAVSAQSGHCGIANVLDNDRKPRIVPARLRWPCGAWDVKSECREIPEDWLASFNMVIAADCLFLSENHEGLLATVNALLSSAPGSVFLCVAPLRHGTFQKFLNLAQCHSEALRLTCQTFPPEDVFPKLVGLVKSADETERLVPHLLLLHRY